MLKTYIRILFQHYTSFGDRKNLAYIQSNKVQKMMKESNIIGKKVTKKDVDILFLKINKSKPNMYFEDFIKLLGEIAILKYGGDEDEAFGSLLEDHLLKRVDELGGIEKTKPKEVEYDEIIEELFIHSINLMYDIYHSYFTFRIDRVDKATQKEVQRCEKYMFEFLRDFEISPKLLSKSQVYNIWTHVLECSEEKKKAIYKDASKQLSKSYDIKEENKLFTFAYFLDFVVCLANTKFMKKKVSNAESVVKLMTAMENSRGFANFEHKMHRTHSSASSLLPPESITKKIKKSSCSDEEEKEEVKEEVDILDRLSAKIGKPKGSGSSKKVSSTKDTLAPKKTAKKTRKGSTGSSKKVESVAVTDEYSDEVKELIPQVKTIFSYYCSYGDTGNKTKLKSSTFVKLLKEAKIVK